MEPCNARRTNCRWQVPALMRHLSRGVRSAYQSKKALVLHPAHEDGNAAEMKGEREKEKEKMK